jgi:hypothetical protein
MDDTVDVTVYLERTRTGSYLTKVIEVPRHLNNKDKVRFLNVYLDKFYDRTYFEPSDESIRDLGLNDYEHYWTTDDDFNGELDL